MMNKHLPKIFFLLLRSICYTFFFTFLTSLFCFAQQWQHLGLYGEDIETIAIDPTNPNIIFAGSTSDASAGKTGSLFKSTNSGITWDTLVKNITVRDIDFHPNDPNTVFVCGGLNGLTVSKIIKTTNAGQSWFRSDSGITLQGWVGPGDLEFNQKCPDTLYAGVSGIDGGAFYKSTNGGKYWHKIVGPNPNDFSDGITAIGVDPKNTNNLYVATNGTSKVFFSSNGGQSWLDKGTKNEIVHAIKFSNSNRIYLGSTALAGHISGLYFSIDSFKTWQQLNPGFTNNTHVTKIFIMGDSIYLSGSFRLYRIISDSILEEIQIDGEKCKEVVINGNNIYIGTENGVMRRDILTQIESANFFVPQSSRLYQNYPNPFNPTTDINYELAEPSMVKLSIFNSIGQKVAMLTNEEQVAGKYNIKWNAEKLPSGVYFVRLQAGKYNSTKRMVLQK